jgi:hypothetical protein
LPANAAFANTSLAGIPEGHKSPLLHNAICCVFLEVDAIVFVNKFLRVPCVFAVIMGFMDEHCSMVWPR